MAHTLERFTVTVTPTKKPRPQLIAKSNQGMLVAYSNWQTLIALLEHSDPQAPVFIRIEGFTL
jgi:hypothetical protein